MTTLVALETPAQVDYLTTLRKDQISDEERTYVVHAPATPEVGEDWSNCRNECATLADSWVFRFARGDGPPAHRLVEFAGDHVVDKIILVAPNRTATGKVEIGSTVRKILLADSIRGEFTIDGKFLILDNLVYHSQRR